MFRSAFQFLLALFLTAHFAVTVAGADDLAELETRLKKIDMRLYAQTEADIRDWLDARIKATGAFGVYPFFSGKYVRTGENKATIDLNRGALADSAAQLFRAYEMFGDEAFLRAGLKTADFFLAVQQPAGHFPTGAAIEVTGDGEKAASKITSGGGKHPVEHVRMEDGYQFRPFALLLYAHRLTGERRYLDGARRCADLVARRVQHPDWGWCADLFDTQTEGDVRNQPQRHGNFGVQGGGSYSDYATTDGFRIALFAYHATGDKKYLRRAARLGDWIFVTQLGKGEVRGWGDNYGADNKPVGARSFEGIQIDPRNFNRFVGPLLTWFYAITGEERYRKLFEETYEWMRSVEQPGGWASEYTAGGQPCATLNHKLYLYSEPESWPPGATPGVGRGKVQLDDSQIVYEILNRGGHGELLRWFRPKAPWSEADKLRARIAAARRATDEDRAARLGSRKEDGVNGAVDGKFLERMRLRWAGLKPDSLPAVDALGRTGLSLQSWHSPHTFVEPYRPPFGWASWQYVWDVRLALGKIPVEEASRPRGFENQHYWEPWDVMGDWTARAVDVDSWVDAPLQEAAAR
jgi:hypothetical protein